MPSRSVFATAVPSSHDKVGSRLVLQETGFVRQKQLLKFVPYSKTTLWRRVKSGAFPAPIHLSAGITAWRAEEVHRWIAQMSAADAEEAPAPRPER